MNVESGGYEYDVALSFAGEDRAAVEQFATLLRAQSLKVFYDSWEQASLWGRDLYRHLDEVYSKRARFCVMFLSAHYATKAWTNHELKAAQARAYRENEEYILPVRLDDTDIPGIRPTTGYLDLRRLSVEELAQIAIQKIIGARARAAVVKGGKESGDAAFRKPALPVAPSSNLRVKKEFTERDRDTFLEETYEYVSKFFERSLAELQVRNVSIAGTFRRVNSDHFTATIYRNGKKVSACGVRLGGSGGVFSNQIVYSNDPNSTNCMNEGVSVAEDGHEMYLRASGLSTMLSGRAKDRLSQQEAAELFWSLLIAPIQR
jgi:hypothetical protein